VSKSSAKPTHAAIDDLLKYFSMLRRRRIVWGWMAIRLCRIEGDVKTFLSRLAERNSDQSGGRICGRRRSRRHAMRITAANAIPPTTGKNEVCGSSIAPVRKQAPKKNSHLIAGIGGPAISAFGRVDAGNRVIRYPQAQRRLCNEQYSSVVPDRIGKRGPGNMQTTWQTATLRDTGVALFLHNWRCTNRWVH